MEMQGKFWGRTSPLFNRNNVEINRIEAGKDGFSSEHKHTAKYNMFVVERGCLLITVWKDPSGQPDKTFIRPGQTCTVPPGFYHSFQAVEDTVAYEIYWTQLDADDIQRRTSGGSK